MGRELAILFFTALIPCVGVSAVQELGLDQALQLAEQASPLLEAGRARETAIQAGADAARAAFYPSLEIGAVASGGFPGSTGASTGVAGLAASPYRSGEAYDVFSKISIVDRERDTTVAQADRRVESARIRTAVLRARVHQLALQTYLETSRALSHLQTWKEMNIEITETAQIVAKLVKTGQHSPVSRLLVQDQKTDAQNKIIIYEARYRAGLRKLAILTGRALSDLSCVPASKLDNSKLAFLKGAGVAPTLAQAEAEIHIAESGLAKAKSERYPKVIAVGSMGDMQAARLVPKDDKAAAVGISMPIFEGFRISSDVRRAQAELLEKKKYREQVQLEIESLVADYEERAAAAASQLELLKTEYDSAVEALKLAKVRYVSYRGLLVDVREAIRNLARISDDTDDAKADLVLALGSKAILQGAIGR